MSTDSKSVGAKLLPVVELSKSSSDIERKDENSYLMLDLQYLRDIIFVEDIHFNVVYASPAAISLFGYTEEEIINLEKKDYMTPDSFNRAFESFRKYYALAQKEKDIDIPLMEYEYIRKDGSTFTDCSTSS